MLILYVDPCMLVAAADVGNRPLMISTTNGVGGCALRQERDVYSNDVAWSAHPVRGEWKSSPDDFQLHC